MPPSGEHIDEGRGGGLRGAFFIALRRSGTGVGRVAEAGDHVTQGILDDVVEVVGGQIELDGDRGVDSAGPCSELDVWHGRLGAVPPEDQFHRGRIHRHTQ